MSQKIFSVDEIKLQILKSNPPILYIVVYGTVNSSGWKNPQLVPYVYINPPEDGIYEFDFVAEPPSGMVLHVMMPVIAQGHWQDFPKELKGVKIYASSNQKTELLSGAGEMKLVEGVGSGNPSGVFI